MKRFPLPPRQTPPRKVSAKRLARVGPRAAYSSITVPRKPLPKRNAPRAVSEARRVYGGYDRVRWVRRLPSVVSGEGPCVNAHVKTGGTSRKADACWIVPLTEAEHRELHQIGVRSFERKYGVDLTMLAIRTEREWQHYTKALLTHDS